MAASLSQTLIRRISSSSPRFLSLSRRCYSGYPDFPDVDSVPPSPAEATAVKIIEDAVHRVIVSRSEPDWLPFVPGSSYWVPPKRRNFGVAELLRAIPNTHLGHVDHQVLAALIASRSWPSSSFYSGDGDSEKEGEDGERSPGFSTSMEAIDD